MDGNIDKRAYLSALEESIKAICFDRTSGKRYLFERLYYPIKLDSGKNAFLNHKDQLELAKQEFEKTNYKNEENKKLSEIITRTTEKELRRRHAGNLENEKATTVENQSASKISSESSNRQELLLAKKMIAKLLDKDETDEDNSSFQQHNNDESYIGKKSSSNVINFQDNRLNVALDRDTKDDYGLYLESSYANKQSLFVETNRVIAIANAGHGKTTLLKRIALFYCYNAFPDLRDNDTVKSMNVEEHDLVKRAYGLDDKREYIPCYITLRKYTEGIENLDSYINDSIAEVFAERGSNPSLESIKTFLQEERENILLLIDGLDEVSSTMGEQFLLILGEYLARYPKTMVMMTTRIAGIIAPEILLTLRQLNFIGRAILPLTDEDAEAYSVKWIEETQEGELTQNNLKKRLSQILSKSKYAFLKEFMRTPLELLVILKQLANDSLSLDRYQLFYDMLFELFTSHERVDKKGIVFEDTMSVLGCIAYQMQIKGSLYISQKELGLVLDNLNALSYHSGIIITGEVSDYICFLDKIAMNVGIVEKEQRDGDDIYTFPIRSYQEYLAAYACCHLVVEVDSIRPEPFKILSKKMFEDEWTRIIIFALADLYTKNESEFEKLIEYIFLNENNTTRLCAYIESDLELTKNQARIVCERFLNSSVLLDKQKNIVMAWSGTKSAYAFNFALKNLFMGSEGRLYGAACAFSIVIDAFMGNNEDFSLLTGDLKGNNPKKCMLGAAIISECIALFYEEDVEGYSDIASKQIGLLDEVIPLLLENAKKYKDVSSIKAIVDICIVRNYKESIYRQYLDEELRSYIMEYIYEKEQDAMFICLGNYQEKPDELFELLEAFTILGSFPIVKCDGKKNIGFYLEIILKLLFEFSKEMSNVDQAAMAVSMWYSFGDYEQFIETWTHDICKEKELDSYYSFVRKNYCSKREQAHFEILKRNRAVLETAIKYLQIKGKNINRSAYLDKASNMEMIFACNNDVCGYLKKAHINEYSHLSEIIRNAVVAEEEGVFSLFRKRDILGAVKFCMKNLGKDATANLVNLGFLLRYGKIRDSSLLPYSYDVVPKILENAVSEGERYAIMNLALFYFENERFDDARLLLKKLSVDDWKELSYGFWKQELWDTTEDPEGALVCVLAHKYGRCDFIGYEKMVKVVKKNYKTVYQEINTRLD